MKCKTKIYIYILLCALIILVCVMTCKFEMRRGQDGSIAVWSLVDNVNSNAVQINGREERTDNPYGYNVGRIEDEKIEKAVLIMPRTLIEIKGTVKSEEASLDLSYAIHPWVADESDGACLNIDIIAEGQEKQNYVYDVNAEMVTKTISLKWLVDYDNFVIKIYVTNKEEKNEDCDWVVLKDFTILGLFEEGLSECLETEYVRSATYFADEWPINFWNSEMDDIDSDFVQIKKDGFDSIILCIPWREFQTGISPIIYNDYAFDKLDMVMKKAMQADLGVYTRVGYLWDYYDDQQDNIVDRYCRLMGDIEVQEAWYDYIGRLYVTLSSYESFRGGFLTWEDFYNNLGVCDESNETVRLEKAWSLGYQQYVKDNYTLLEYNEKYLTSFASFEEIPIPQRDETAMQVMYAFQDNFLNSLLDKSQEKFPDLSMEVRLDWDAFYLNDGNMDYYKHIETFSCGNASFTTIMYGIPMGFENIGERVGYMEALQKTEYILQQFKLQNGNKPVYIDQFIFADNTPAFKNNAQIKEKELNDYLENVAGILLEYSEGYGIWTYRNYCANMLYNSQFALKGDGWFFNEDAFFEKLADSNICKLGSGGRIQQIVPDIRNHFDSDEYILEFEVINVEKPGKLVAAVGDVERIVEVEKAGKVRMVFYKSSSFDIIVESKDCCVYIDNLKLYSQVQQGYLYDQNYSELQCIEGIRTLNKKLQ